MEPQRKLFWIHWGENASIMVSMASEMALYECVELELVDTENSDGRYEWKRKNFRTYFLKVWRQKMGFLFRRRKEESELYFKARSSTSHCVLFSCQAYNIQLLTPHFEILLTSVLHRLVTLSYIQLSFRKLIFNLSKLT